MLDWAQVIVDDMAVKITKAIKKYFSIFTSDFYRHRSVDCEIQIKSP
jgi:hypothetical protein